MPPILSHGRSAKRVLAFEDLGLEATHGFEAEDISVTVAADSRGRPIYKSGLQYWRGRSKDILVAVRQLWVWDR